MEIEAIGVVWVEDERRDAALGVAGGEARYGVAAQAVRMERVDGLPEVVHVNVTCVRYIGAQHHRRASKQQQTFISSHAKQLAPVKRVRTGLGADVDHVAIVAYLQAAVVAPRYRPSSSAIEECGEWAALDGGGGESTADVW